MIVSDEIYYYPWLKSQNINDKDGPLQIYFPGLQLLRSGKVMKTF